MARRRQVWVASLLCVAGLLGPSQLEAAGASPATPGVAVAIAPWQGPAPNVLIETDRGKLTLELYPDVAPRTVARFVALVQKGFYNGLTFHRVVPKFLIQGGDPAGDGTGGSGLPIPAEFSEKKHGTGTMGMARLRDPDSADSQFYICLEPQPFLDGKFTVFGQVVEGLDVLPKIQEGDVMRKVTLKP
jgi:peptidyl-prolyl cis-trans isomerase B (cyclophilin B)